MRSLLKRATLKTPAESATFAPLAVATRAVVPTNRLVWAIGDSITSRGNTWGIGQTGLGTSELSLGDFSYLGYLMLASNGRLRPGGIAATAGYTLAQIRATHLPTVLAASPKPGICVVLGGTNGVTAGSVASQMADLTAIWSALIAAGIQPIACTIPPSGAASVADNSPTVILNTAIKRYCRRNGILVADLYAALVNPATGAFLTAYDSGDHIHPSAAGAQVIGQTVWAVVSAVAPASGSELFSTNTNAGMLLGAANATLQTTGAVSEGTYPSNWGRPNAPAGAVVTTTTETGVAGNMFTVTSGAGGEADWWSDTFTAPAGHRIYVGWKVKGHAVGGGSWGARVEATDGTGTVVGYESIPVDNVTATEVGFEFDMPAGTTTTLRLRILPAGNGSYVGVGQVTAIDLTAAGITP